MEIDVPVHCKPAGGLVSSQGVYNRIRRHGYSTAQSLEVTYAFVARHDRHHKLMRGHKFSIVMRARSGIRSAVSSTPTPERKARTHPSEKTSAPK
jgi:hypothetical protein